MKLRPYLQKPVDDWTEVAGMRRAIAVLRDEATVLRKQGFAMQPAALRRVANALQRAIAKKEAQAEAVTLRWAERIANPGGDDHA